MLNSFIHSFKKYSNKYFDKYVYKTNEACEVCDKYELRIFTAKLFIKMMYLDGKVSINEEKTVKKAIADCFDLSLKDVNELFLLTNELFDYEAHCSTLSQQINQSCSMEQKNKIIEHLWHIAYSDHNLDEKEEDMIMGISECLQIPYIMIEKARLKAQNLIADRKWTN